MAMENLIKAIHIKQKTSWSSDLSWTSGGHNQIELARQANIPLEESEEELLRSLSAFVVWAGRYPVPKNADQLFLKQRKKGQKSKRWFPEVLNEMEYKAIEELFRKLNSILSPKLKKLGSRYIG